MLKRYKNSYLSYFLMYNFYYLSWAVFSALISVYLLGKGFKASEVSLVVSTSFLTSMIFQPVIGMLSDKYDVKKVFTAENFKIYHQHFRQRFRDTRQSDLIFHRTAGFV